MGHRLAPANTSFADRMPISRAPARVHPDGNSCLLPPFPSRLHRDLGSVGRGFLRISPRLGVDFVLFARSSAKKSRGTIFDFEGVACGCAGISKKPSERSCGAGSVQGSLRPSPRHCATREIAKSISTETSDRLFSPLDQRSLTMRLEQEGCQLRLV